MADALITQTRRYVALGSWLRHWKDCLQDVPTLWTVERLMNWTQHNLVGANDIPAKAGVYVIYFDDEPVYVGQSKDMRARISSYKVRHGYARNIITPWMVTNDEMRVTAKCKASKRLGDWAMWEIRLIHRLQPIFNLVHLKTKRAA